MSAAESMLYDWREWRACKDEPTSTFFPSDFLGVMAAKRICRGCQVRDECALAGAREAGVWGGLTESERGVPDRYWQTGQRGAGPQCFCGRCPACKRRVRYHERKQETST